MKEVLPVAKAADELHRAAFRLATERLRLRPIVPADWEVYRSLYTDPDTMHAIGEPLADDAVGRSFALCQRAWMRQPLRQAILAVTGTRDDVPIGMSGVFNFHNDPCRGACAEVGVMLVPSFRSSGLGPDALRAVIACAFRAFPLDAVISQCSLHNPRAERMVARIGFELPNAEPEPGPFAHRSWVLHRDRWTPA